MRCSDCGHENPDSARFLQRLCGATKLSAPERGKLATLLFGSAQAVDDTTAVEVVRRELDPDAVAREDPDPVPLHLPGHVAERLVTVVQANPEHLASERLEDLALDFELLFLFGHLRSYASNEVRGRAFRAATPQMRRFTSRRT